MHTVRNRSAISRKAKAAGRLPKIQPQSLPPDAKAKLAPAFPANVLVAPPRGAMIRAIPLPGAEVGPREEAEAALILQEKPVRPARRKAVSGKSPRKAKARKAAAPLKRVMKKPAAPAMAVTTAPTPNPPALAEQATGPLPPSRAVVRTSGGGMIQKVVRWLDALGSALIGQPLTRKRRRVVLPKARQALQRRPLSERIPTARQPIDEGTEANTELRQLRLENDRLNRELQLLKAALRQVTPA